MIKRSQTWYNWTKTNWNLSCTIFFIFYFYLAPVNWELHLHEKLLVPPGGPLMWSSLLLPTNRKVPRVLFFGDSAPHQLQTNGLNLIRLFNPMALKFDTSSNYKKIISPPKIFQTLRLLVSPPLEQKSKFSLSRSHRLKLSLFTAQPLGSPVPTMLAFFSSENP